MMTEGMESCAAFSEEEVAALTEDCGRLWDEVKCACISDSSEDSLPVPVVRISMK